MIMILQQEFNYSISNPMNQILGYDTLKEKIEPVTLKWVEIADSLFQDLQEKDPGDYTGYLTGEGLQIFLMALLLNEINQENSQTMPMLISK
jgi:hypothetical protein